MFKSCTAIMEDRVQSNAKKVISVFARDLGPLQIHSTMSVGIRGPRTWTVRVFPDRGC